MADNSGMCGRFTIYRDIPIVAQFVGAPEPTFDWTPRYNLLPTQPALACRLDARQGRELVRLRWGLVPSWARDLSIGNKAINARTDGVTYRPMFRAAFKRRRCLIPVNGYYEWKKLGAKKQPYFIHPVPRGEVMALAGLWETWRGDKEPVESFTIITTEASGALRPLHDRTPVFLPPHRFEEWLDPSSTETELVDLLRPVPDGALAFYAVSTRVNNGKQDDPRLIEPLADVFPS